MSHPPGQSSHFGLWPPWLRVSGLALWLGGCSILTQMGGQQCATHSDCRQLGLSAGRCVDGACQLTRPCADGGTCMQAAATQACSASLPCGDPAQVCLNFECADASQVHAFVCSPAPVEPADSVSFKANVRDPATMKPPRGLTVAACDVSDLGCEMPYASTTDHDGNGDIMLQLPWGFAGFLEIHGDDMTTVFYYLDQPLYGASETRTIFLATPATLAPSGAQTSAESGLVVVQMYDCMQRAAAGIHFEIDKPAAVPFFLVDGTPSVEVQTSMYDSGRDAAIGGFANVNAGAAIVSARLGTKGPRLAWYKVDVRQKSVTQLELRPDPNMSK